MEAIIKALVDAGYFRARISNLSDFDKIIGGMAWAMQIFSYDINIDVFYTDALDLGQKIALTERLVMVMLAMRCPHRLEPHQIVGLDYANLLPALRWLIKRSEEVRREQEAFNRLLALRHYHRVTNTTPDRSSWCHLVKAAHLRCLDLSAGGQVGSGGLDEGVSAATSKAATAKLMERIDETFKDNQRISFVQLPSLFTKAANLSQQKQQQQLRASGQVGPSDSFLEEEEEEEASSAKDFDSEPRNRSTGGLDPMEAEGAPRVANEMSSAELAQHCELDGELLATNQKILNLLRKLDSMPSQLEIVQYQRRYIELHQQLISKNRDVKKLYDLFNSLDSIKHYLSKEIALLDSISSNLDLTSNSAANRDLFMRQFRAIIEKIQQVRADVETRRQTLERKCRALNAEFASLMESQNEEEEEEEAEG